MNGFLTKAGIATVMAASALVGAAPAEAQRYYRHYDRGGDVATGALIGGVVGLGIGAAIASDRGRYYDRGYRGYYDGPRYRYGPPRRFYRDRYWGPPPPRYYRPYRGYYGPRGYYGW